MLNELVKKQLAEFYKKGKLQRSIKHLPKHTQLQVELSSSDSEYSSSDISVKCKSKKSKKVKVLKYSSRSDSSESTDTESSDSDSSISDNKSNKKTNKNKFYSESDSGSSKNKSKKNKSKRKSKSGMVAKASDDVVNPQTWPQTALQYEFINKSVTFQELDLKLFVAGELEIISSKKIKSFERKARLNLLKKMVYYSSSYTWKALLDFYAAFVRQIELGNRTWKNDPSDLEVPLLSKHVKQDFNKKSSYNVKKEFKTPSVWYCAGFQKNKCSKSSPHSTVIRGVDREVQHICASCYRLDKIKNFHPECSSACLHYNE